MQFNSDQLFSDQTIYKPPSVIVYVPHPKTDTNIKNNAQVILLTCSPCSRGDFSVFAHSSNQYCPFEIPVTLFI